MSDTWVFCEVPCLVPSTRYEVPGLLPPDTGTMSMSSNWFRL